MKPFINWSMFVGKVWTVGISLGWFSGEDPKLFELRIVDWMKFLSSGWTVTLFSLTILKFNFSLWLDYD